MSAEYFIPGNGSIFNSNNTVCLEGNGFIMGDENQGLTVVDVTFREDSNHTLDKIAAQNQNIIRKWCLSILKLLEIRGKKMSLQRKRFNIGMNPMKYLEEILAL